jgi:hypothetical protein
MVYFIMIVPYITTRMKPGDTCIREHASNDRHVSNGVGSSVKITQQVILKKVDSH